MEPKMGQSPSDEIEKPVKIKLSDYFGYLDHKLNDLFSPAKIGDEEKETTILEAIDKNEITGYFPYMNDKQQDVVHMLISIEEELGSDKRDDEDVEQMVKQLERFLGVYN